ncbi:hypothetical protein [Thalassotalea sediminis]|uniref:hypothetical protein n=1 Tax=Thalassotalea sediminis TaxID=1759089 RepID=UPI002573A925|nr:hypothetical protein [Thalassotalea sediminis]
MKKGLLVNAFVLFSVMSQVSLAGEYTEQLGKCLVSSTTEDDRNKLVRWMFVAASNHPAVDDLVQSSADKLDMANKHLGQLITRLVTVACKNETKRAIENEGEVALEASFNVLGKVAGQELFSHPSVAIGLSGLSQYVDGAAINNSIN